MVSGYGSASLTVTVRERAASTYIIEWTLQFFELCIVIYLCNKNQQNAHFLHLCFNHGVFNMFGTSSVHPQEDLYMQFYFVLNILYSDNSCSILL
jgi:hypothetical protein